MAKKIAYFSVPDVLAAAMVAGQADAARCGLSKPYDVASCVMGRLLEAGYRVTRDPKVAAKPIDARVRPEDVVERAAVWMPRFKFVDAEKYKAQTILPDGGVMERRSVWTRSRGNHYEYHCACGWRHTTYAKESDTAYVIGHAGGSHTAGAGR